MISKSGRWLKDADEVSTFVRHVCTNRLIEMKLLMAEPGCGIAVPLESSRHFTVQRGFLGACISLFLIFVQQRLGMRLQVLGTPAVKIAFILVVLKQLFLFLHFCLGRGCHIFVVFCYGFMVAWCRGVSSSSVDIEILICCQCRGTQGGKEAKQGQSSKELFHFHHHTSTVKTRRISCVNILSVLSVNNT